MTEKAIGYFFIIAGVLLMVFSGLNVYQVFTKQIRPVSFFNFQPITVDASKLVPSIPNQLGIEQPKPQPIEFISADIINDSSNLFAHIMLMGFMATIGSRIATVGTQMVRPIVVHVNSKKHQDEV